MSKLTKHFSRHEFACKDGCGMAVVDVDILAMLEEVRSWAGAPVHITSGSRCEEHNAKIGGSPTSYHVKGMAVDFKVEGFEPKAIYDLLEEWYPDSKGIGLYSSWVHFDLREDKARWVK